MKIKRTIWGLPLLVGTLFVACAQSKYDATKLQREKLGRGVIAIRQSESETCLTWRYLSNDPLETAFNIYRNGKQVATVPAGKATMWVDKEKGGQATTYEVRPVVNGVATHETDW